MSTKLAFALTVLCGLALGSVSARAQPPGGEAPPQPAPPASAAPPAPAPTPPPVVPPAAVAPAPPAEQGTPAIVLSPEESEGIIGKSVRSAAGEDMGRIVDIIVSGNNQPRAAVIDFGGFLGVGSRKIAVDWRLLQYSRTGKTWGVTFALTRNQVRVSPEYKPGEPVVVLSMPPIPPTSAQPASVPAGPASSPPPAPPVPAPDPSATAPAPSPPGPAPSQAQDLSTPPARPPQ